MTDISPFFISEFMNKVKNLIGGEDKFCFEKKTNKDDIISDDNEI